MSTYRERREARADNLAEWADKRETRAAELHERNEPYRGDVAFNTQPGHIPERARALARTERAWEHERKADEMRRRSAGIENQLAASIYDDDPDAVEQLEQRIAALEAERDRIKAYNATCRKGARDVTLLDETQQADLASTARACPYMIGAKGEFPRYALTNLSGNIKRNRDRLERLRREATAPPSPGRLLSLKYAGTCSECAVELEKGTTAYYRRSDRTVTCQDCATIPA